MSKKYNDDMNIDDIIIKNEFLAYMCESLKGLKKRIVFKTIQTVPFHPPTAQEQYQKRPMILNGESWVNHVYLISEYNTVFIYSIPGFKLGKPSNYMFCWDVDGHKGGGDDLRVRSCEYIFNSLRDNIPDFDKKFFWERTSSGGYHIFGFYNPNSPFVKKHASSGKFRYSKNCPIPELAGKSLKGDIENFDGRGINENGEEVSNRGVKVHIEDSIKKNYPVFFGQTDLDKLPVIDNIEEELENALLKAGFERVLDLNNSNFNEFEHKSNGGIPIPHENLPLLAEFLGELYKEFDARNCKFYATQALAGYLYFHTDIDSASLLAGYLIEYCGYLFEDSKLFYNTLMNDFHNPPASNVFAQGGVKFYEDYCADLISRDVFWPKMIFLMGGNLEFFIGDRNARSINQIVINREKCKVYLNNFVETKYDGGYYYKLNSSKEVMGLCPISLEVISNPLNPNESEMVISCVSHSGKKVIRASNAESLLDSFKSINGAILNKYHFGDVLNQIIAKFFELDLVKTSEKSSLTGVFIINEELVRYNSKGEKVRIYLPTRDGLIEALSLIENVLEVIPHDKGEIGLLLRKYFLYPFHYYYKSNGRGITFIVISGTGGTLKSTLAELILSIYQYIIKSGDASNVIGGGAFDSEFKIAKAMGNSTLGFIVNEPDMLLAELNYVKFSKSQRQN